MKCPKCTSDETKVLESRLSHEGRSVRRRRACLDCGHRFTTYEREEMFVFSVRKKDDRVEPYNRTKILGAIRTACQKRPVSQEQIDFVVGAIERSVQEAGERTVSSGRLGDLVMDHLKKLDKVAYVRFASVYRDFQDPAEFTQTIRSLNAPVPAPTGEGDNPRTPH